MNTAKDLRGLAAGALLTLAALASACASSGNNRPRPFPMPAAGPTVAPPVQTPGAAPQTLIDTALSFRGTPYRNGGSDPGGFDCSGFTQWVFSRHGIALPREVHDQFKAGKKIDEDDLQPGDLVFFHTISKGASHVGIVIADDEFVHAPSSKGVVRVEHLSSSYWSRRLVGARRVPVAAERAQPEPAVVKRRPSGGESTVAAAAAAPTGAPGSRAAD